MDFDFEAFWTNSMLRSARSIRQGCWQALNFETGFMCGLRAGMNQGQQRIDPALVESAINIAHARCRGISA